MTELVTLSTLVGRGDELLGLAESWLQAQRYDRAATCATLATAYYSAVTARVVTSHQAHDGGGR